MTLNAEELKRIKRDAIQMCQHEGYSRGFPSRHWARRACEEVADRLWPWVPQPSERELDAIAAELVPKPDLVLSPAIIRKALRLYGFHADRPDP